MRLLQYVLLLLLLPLLMLRLLLLWWQRRRLQYLLLMVLLLLLAMRNLHTSHTARSPKRSRSRQRHAWHFCKAAILLDLKQLSASSCLVLHPSPQR
jgi:hypothetical protein